MKPQFRLLILIACCLLLTTNIAGSPQFLPLQENDETKYKVIIGDFVTYEYTKVNFSNESQQNVLTIPIIDENGEPSSTIIHEGVQFTVLVSNITVDDDPFNFLRQRKQIFTQIDYDGILTRESSSNVFIVPITDNISYWDEIYNDNTDPNVNYTIEGSILTLSALRTQTIWLTKYDMRSSWITFLNQQTFDSEGNLERELEITMISGSQASDIVIPFVNISIPSTIIGILIVVPVALAGGMLLAKLLKR